MPPREQADPAGPGGEHLPAGNPGDLVGGVGRSTVAAIDAVAGPLEALALEYHLSGLRHLPGTPGFLVADIHPPGTRVDVKAFEDAALARLGVDVEVLTSDLHEAVIMAAGARPISPPAPDYGTGSEEATDSGADGASASPAAADQDASALAAAMEAVRSYVAGGSDAGPYLDQIRAGEASGLEPFRNLHRNRDDEPPPDPDAS